MRRLLARGQMVRVLSRPNSDHTNIKSLNVEICEGDLLYPESIRDAVEGCEACFMSQPTIAYGLRDPDKMFKVNVEGTQSVIEAATDAGVRRLFIQVVSRCLKLSARTR